MLSFIACFEIVAEKVVYELKWRYIRSVLRQEEEWFDAHNCNELSTTINSNITEIEVSIGKGLAIIIYCFGNSIGSIAISFYIGVIFTLPMLIIWIYILGAGVFQIQMLKKGEAKDEQTFLKSGADAEEAINAIKVVKAFGQEKQEVKKFETHLSETNDQITRQSWYFGIAKGLLESALYFVPTYGLFLGGIFVTAQVSHFKIISL